MPYTGKLEVCPQEVWDNIPEPMQKQMLTCRMPVGGDFLRPGRLTAVDDEGEPGFSSRAVRWKNNEVGTEPEWHEDEDIAYFGAIWSPYKLWKISEDIVMLKIINFGNDETGRESMWVEVTDGNDKEGIGILKNQPFGIPWLNVDDVIRYGGGTDKSKAGFIEKITEEE